MRVRPTAGRGVAVAADGHSLDDVLAFTRVVEAGSFAAAGTAMGVTPSALSKAVSRLEAGLGTRLLHRTTRALNLTDAGQAFYGKCSDALRSLDEARSEVAARGAQPVGRLRVGLPVSLSRALFAPRLAEFLVRHPKLELQLHASDKVADLVAEALDVVVRVGELGSSSLHARRLGALPSVTCASPSLLARVGAPPSPADLDPRECLAALVPASGQRRAWAFERSGERRTIVPGGALAFGDTESLLAAAVAGLGFARLAYATAADALRSGALVPILPEWDHGSREVTALYLHGNSPGPATRAFIDFAVLLFRRSASELERRRRGPR